MLRAFSTARRWMHEPTIVFHGGPIRTMADPPIVDAVAIKGSRIVAVGRQVNVPGLRDATAVDLEGRCLLPGLSDCHSHWFANHLNQGPGSGDPEGLRAAARSGWTSVTEHFLDQDRIDRLHQLAPTWTPPVRLNGYLPVNWRSDKFAPWYLCYRQGQYIVPRVRVAGAKVFADGGGDWYTSEPYTSEPSTSGAFFWTRDELACMFRILHDHGFQIAVHSMGDASTGIVLDAYADLDPGSNRRRHNITHLSLLSDDLISRLAQQKIVAIPQLGWFHAGWESDLNEKFGPERQRLVGRWRDLLDAGVEIGGSTDYPWGEVGSVARTLHVATTRIGEDGTRPSPTVARQRITTQQALEALTVTAARVMGRRSDLGSIQIGKLADFTVLTHDPVALPPTDLLKVDVAMTMVGGRISYLGTSGDGLRPPGTPPPLL